MTDIGKRRLVGLFRLGVGSVGKAFAMPTEGSDFNPRTQVKELGVVAVL